MGTNFYLHETPCPSCHRSEVIHIGKRSAGWSFGFRGYRHDGEDHISPLAVPVLSRADWLKVLADYSGTVRDEYGRQVDDPIAWLKSLDAPDVKQRRWEDSHMGPYWRSDDRDWRDAEGFRFYDGDFS